MPNSKYNCGESCPFSGFPPAGDRFTATIEGHLVEEGISKRNGDLSQGEFERLVIEKGVGKQRIAAARECASMILAGQCKLPEHMVGEHV